MIRRRQPERIEQAGIVKLLRSLGATVYVLGMTRRRGDHPGTMQTPGLPDLLAFIRRPDDGPVLLAIECKAVGGRLSEAQRGFRALCQQAAVAHVVGGIDAVIAWLLERGYLKADQVAHYRVKEATP